MKYSNNKKLNSVLTSIEESILNSSDTPEMAISEIKRYKKEFPRESDYNYAQYGNLLIGYWEVYKLYRDCGYKTTDQYSCAKIWETYKRQVGYVIRCLLSEYV